MRVSDRQTIRCAACRLNQFMTASGDCRRCRLPLVKPVSGACEDNPPNNALTRVPTNELGNYDDMQPIGATVGDRLRKARKALRISQEEIAFRAHVSQQWVSMIERGIGNAQIGTIERYMAVMKIPLVALLGTPEDFDFFLEGRKK